MVKHIKQPKNSGLCGQACVAMALNITLDEACKLVGHSKRKGTKTKDLIRAINESPYSIKTPDKRLRRIKKNGWISKRAIVKEKIGAFVLIWHWVYKDGCNIYDPSSDGAVGFLQYNGHENFTSFLEIEAAQS
jgi:hypothetical protein